MSDAIFVYGTLMVPEIWQAVTLVSANVKPRPAVLRGYNCRRVTGADFPGIIASGEEGDVVEGCVFENVTPDILDRLDRYEDDFYKRIEVPVHLVGESSMSLPCQTYVVPESAADVLSDTPWDLEWFKANALNRYLTALEFQSPDP